MITPPIVAQDGPMDRTSYLASLQADTALLLTTAGGALDRDVPTCPGWTCERLIGHIGRVHRWTARWVSTGGAQDVERPPAGEAVVAWARSGLDELVAAITAADDDNATVETWYGPQPATFWPRRMAIETALHRYDAQVAAGVPTPVDTALAIDAIDELFAVVLPMRGTGGPEVRHVHAKGDVAVRATASDLLLLLWNRLGPDRFEVFGDTGLLARW